MEDLIIFFILWLALPVFVTIVRIKWRWYFLISVLLAFTLTFSGYSFTNDKIDLFIIGFGILFMWVGLHKFILNSGGNRVMYFMLVFIGMYTYVLIPNMMGVGIQEPHQDSHEDGYIIKARACVGTSAKSGTDIVVSKCIGLNAIFEREVLLASDFSSSYIAYGGSSNFNYNIQSNELYVEWFDDEGQTGIDTFSKRNNFIQMYLHYP